jgi:hypothetical protein
MAEGRDKPTGGGIDPAAILGLVAALSVGAMTMSQALQVVVADLVAEGWTEPQARELAIALATNALRGQQAAPVEGAEGKP